MADHKNHKIFTVDCIICDEIAQHCSFATKEGYADFMDMDKKNPLDWEAMQDYYDKCQSIDPTDY